jgi:hypothetical protein
MHTLEMFKSGRARLLAAGWGAGFSDVWPFFSIDAARADKPSVCQSPIKKMGRTAKARPKV